MSKDNKKPRSFKSLAAEKDQGFGNIHIADGHQQHADRITRAALLKQRSKDQEQYLFGLSEDFQLSVKEQDYYEGIAKRMSACAHYMLFRDYFTLEKVKLVDLKRCQLHLLCPFCAAGRAGNQVNAYSDKLDLILAASPRLKPVFITLTVKNGVDLVERFEHLVKSFKTMNERRRDWKKKGWGHVEFCKVQGAVFSYEVTFNEVTKEWHPHLHIFGLLDSWIDQSVLSAEWFEITGDSHVVDVRRVRKVNGGYREAFQEVFKYALKFSDMSLSSTLEAYLCLKMRRLQGSFGLFRGVVVPDSILDDFSNLEGIPYLERRYKFATRVGYSLVATRLITPSEHLSASAESKATAQRRACEGVKYKYVEI
jgi:hypothetical protein